MTSATLTIPDGTTLTDARDRDGRVFGVDSVTSRTCTYEGDEAGGRLVDSAGELVREVVPAAAGRLKAGTRSTSRVRAGRAERSCDAGAGTLPRPAPAKGKPMGDRWRTFNEFVDVIQPHLPLAVGRVWVVAFRHARGGKVELTVRTTAKAAGVSESTAADALSRLVRAGLLWVIWKSKDRMKGSLYGVHPSPGDLLGKVITVPAIGTVENGNRTDHRYG